MSWRGLISWSLSASVASGMFIAMFLVLAVEKGTWGSWALAIGVILVSLIVYLYMDTQLQYMVEKMVERASNGD